MQKYILFFIFFFAITNVFAQEENKKTEPVFEFVDELPEFPGGSSKMVDFIRDKLKYPKSARKAGIQGSTYVSFIVGPDGAIRDIKILKSLGPDFDKAAMDVMQQMPRWKPGKQNGRAVSTRMTIPLKFIILDEKKSKEEDDK